MSEPTTNQNYPFRCMQYAYALEDLVLVHTCPAYEGGYSAVYDLPAPRPWRLHIYDCGEGDDEDTFADAGTIDRLVSRVRISIGPDYIDEHMPTGDWSAVVVPTTRGRRTYSTRLSLSV